MQGRLLKYWRLFLKKNFFLGPSLNFVDLFADPSIINWVANGPVSFVVYPNNQICLCSL